MPANQVDQKIENLLWGYARLIRLIDSRLNDAKDCGAETKETIDLQYKQAEIDYRQQILNVARGYSNPTVEEFGKDGMLERREIWKQALKNSRRG